MDFIVRGSVRWSRERPVDQSLANFVCWSVDDCRCNGTRNRQSLTKRADSVGIRLWSVARESVNGTCHR